LVVGGFGSLAATVPPRPAIPPAGDEAKKALNATQDRAKKGEEGYLVGLDRHVHAAAVRRHDDGDCAAIGAMPDAQGARSLRARWLKAQPDHRHSDVNDGPLGFGGVFAHARKLAGMTKPPNGRRLRASRQCPQAPERSVPALSGLKDRRRAGQEQDPDEEAEGLGLEQLHQSHRIPAVRVNAADASIITAMVKRARIAFT
jgi:hypothetical protein